MPLIIQPTTSREELKASAVTNLPRRIQKMASDAYKGLLDVQSNSFKLIWSHPVLTPQEAIDSLGPEGYKAFAMHSILTGAIQQIAALDGVTPELAVPDREITYDPETGKVTIGDLLPTP